MPAPELVQCFHGRSAQIQGGVRSVANGGVDILRRFFQLQGAVRLRRRFDGLRERPLLVAGFRVQMVVVGLQECTFGIVVHPRRPRTK